MRAATARKIYMPRECFSLLVSSTERTLMTTIMIVILSKIFSPLGRKLLISLYKNILLGLKTCHGFAPRQSSTLYSLTKLGETRLARTSTLEFSSALYGIGSARLGVHKRVFRSEDSLPLLLSSCFILIATLVNQIIPLSLRSSVPFVTKY